MEDAQPDGVQAELSDALRRCFGRSMPAFLRLRREQALRTGQNSDRTLGMTLGALTGTGAGGARFELRKEFDRLKHAVVEAMQATPDLSRLCWPAR